MGNVCYSVLIIPFLLVLPWMDWSIHNQTAITMPNKPKGFRRTSCQNQQRQKNESAYLKSIRHIISHLEPCFSTLCEWISCSHTWPYKNDATMTCFVRYGLPYDAYQHAYFTTMCGISMHPVGVKEFLVHLDKTLREVANTSSNNKYKINPKKTPALAPDNP